MTGALLTMWYFFGESNGGSNGYPIWIINGESNGDYHVVKTTRWKPPSWGWLPTNVINSIIIRPKVVTISMGGINQPPPVMVVVCGSQGFPHEAPAEIFCTRATHSPYGIYTAYYIQYMQHV